MFTWTNRKIAAAATAIVAVMTGLAFASDPLYDVFCQVTGFGGTTRIATEAPSEMLSQQIEVRFDANVADTPLVFRPLQTSQTVNIGQHGLAFYEVTNPSAHSISVIASYNVTPHYAGPFFNKLECFCFEERIIGAGETRKLPVVYFVGPDIVEDRTAKDLETITLSYTFFDSSKETAPRNQAVEAAANSSEPS